VKCRVLHSGNGDKNRNFVGRREKGEHYAMWGIIRVEGLRPRRQAGLRSLGTCVESPHPVEKKEGQWSCGREGGKFVEQYGEWRGSS